MSVQLPDVVVVLYLGMLAHFALPATRPIWASNPGSIPKDRFWPIAGVRAGATQLNRVGHPTYVAGRKPISLSPPVAINLIGTSLLRKRSSTIVQPLG